MSDTNPHCHELLAAYALGAATPEESAIVDAHVAVCHECRSELDELQIDTALLAQSVAEAPPSHLRDQVLAAAASGDAITEQVPPTIPVVAPIAAAGRRARPRRHRRTPAWTMPALAAATVLLLGIAGVQSVRVARLQDDLDAKQQARRGEQSTLVADRVTPLETSGPLKRTSAQVAATGDTPTMLVLQDLPAPPLGKSWQAWAIGTDGTKVSIGVLDRANPIAVVQIPASMHGSVDAVAITLEQANGATQPTGAPIAYGAIGQA